MQAARVHAFGGPEQLRYQEVALPEPGPGQALVKIEAIGVNFIDIYHRGGIYPNQLPLTLGTEAAGVIEALDAGVSEGDLAVGTRVAYAGPLGAYAEYAAVPRHGWCRCLRKQVPSKARRRCCKA